MQPTKFQTLTVPAIGPGSQPVALAVATDVPLRALVRNVGAPLLFLSGDSQAVSAAGGPGTDVYRLPATATDVFVIAPKQKLYGVSAAAGGLASVSVSEALPIEYPLVVGK